MPEIDPAIATQLANIEKKTGRTLAQLAKLVQGTGLTKHGEIREHLKRTLGLGHGDANTLTHLVLRSDARTALADAGKSDADAVDDLYAGPKAGLRPIHDRLLEAIARMGPFELVPKKSYVSLRRRKQFATIGPATRTRVDLGLNVRDLPADERLVPQGAGKMCNYVVRLGDPAQVDRAVIGWVRRAFDAAG